MKESSINIRLGLDENKVPERITWNASDTSAEIDRHAKALMLSFWDGAEKNALRIDLWTKEMMVDEMAEFYYQTLTAMADTFQRATKDDDLAGDLKTFAKNFYHKFTDKQTREDKIHTTK